MFVPVFVRSAYNYDMDEASAESGLVCEDESLAVQSALEETDINTIVRRFGVTGEIPISSRIPTYQDYEGVFDYRTALEIVMAADEAFMQVPAEIRARFHNDPGAFADFCSKEINREELQKMGLIDIVETPKPVEPQLVRIVKDEES